MFLVVMFFAGLIAPIDSNSTPPSSPIQIEFEFPDEDSITLIDLPFITYQAFPLELNSSKQLSIEISSRENIENVEITVSLPEEINLIGGDDYWLGDIKKDEIIEMPMDIEIIKSGEFGIRVDADCGTDAPFLCSTMRSLKIIADDNKGVTTSTQPLQTIREIRASTPEEREKLLRLPSKSVPTDPSLLPIVPKPLPDFFLEEDSSLEPGKEFPEDGGVGTNAVYTVTVSGRATSKDSPGRNS